MVFVGILSQIKLLFGPLVIQLVWYILKRMFTSVSVKVVDICKLFSSVSSKHQWQNCFVENAPKIRRLLTMWLTTHDCVIR